MFITSTTTLDQIEAERLTRVQQEDSNYEWTHDELFKLAELEARKSSSPRKAKLTNG